LLAGPLTRGRGQVWRNLMRAQNLLRWVRRQPFRRFRMLLTTGASYIVAHSELLLVGNATVTLELSEPQNLFFKTRREVEISLLHIVQLEEVPPPPPPASNN